MALATEVVSALPVARPPMIKDIMVWLDGSLSDEVRLAASAEIARRFENQVIGLFLNPLPLPGPVPGNVGALATADLTERAREAGGQDGGEAGQALRVLCRPPLPAGIDPRCRQGTQAGLGYVKTLEMQYMRAQLKRAGTPGPRAIGIDEISVRKGRKRSLKILLVANKRLNTAYVLKEAFGQLWDYGREGWARGFFDNWRASLKWQRLGPYDRFADMIDRHWDGIAAYCKPENKVSLGFVEGLNNKIRVFQRRAYGLRDEEYLCLKVLTCMLPPL
jgi:hypothetical protein